MDQEYQNISEPPFGSEQDQTSIPSPDIITKENDPGDDVLRRFRYQVTYAGILSIMMIDTSNYYKEIFCEHHEDILVKHDDDTFTGIQVKTKDINFLPFNIEDEAIIKSITKFVLLNKRFPLKFRNFSIVSNHGFDKTKPAVCINTLIENVSNGVDVLKPKSKSKILITRIAEVCQCAVDLVLDTIRKMRVKTYCQLDHIHIELLHRLKICSKLKGLTESKFNDIADLIIAKTFKASSLFSNELEIQNKYITGVYSGEDEMNEIIKSKQIRREDFEFWLDREREQPVSLFLKDRSLINNEASNYRKLEIKMDAGGIDSENIDIIRDFKFAFEQHAASWIYKNSYDDAELRYSQVLAVTKNLCKEVYDATIVTKSSNGLEMLIGVRQQIKDRRTADPKMFFDCSYEHLLGAVGVLTESCKVWWSPKFEFKK